jgi:hypothetical protein
MIKKALLTTVILLVLHSLYVSFVATNYDTGQHQWQDNIIKAQNYLYETDNPKGVIVGSSLSARIDESILLGEVHNLAMGGLSIYDGLKVVLEKATLPEYVCVETNLITRPASQDFTNSLLSPVLYPVRKVAPSLREKNQPLGLVTGFILDKLNKQERGGKLPASVKDAKKAQQDPVFAKVLQMAKEEKQELPDPVLLAERIKEMKDLLGKLEAKGVKVYFFEMPISFGLCDFPFPTHIREQMATHFPTSQYTYFPTPDCSQYNTTDGAHLDPVSVKAFSSWLKGQLEQQEQQAVGSRQ